ncbi:MAG: DUF3343 domain-containing protein [Clostridia bacterium]|nr:DUF3343 domain-containing protein [Clostridia bacterium]
MNYTLAVFKSRFSTLNFSNLLKANHIPVAIINTPHSISQACGLSVKFLSDYFSKVQTLLTRINLSQFQGFYTYTEMHGRISLIKL